MSLRRAVRLALVALTLFLALVGLLILVFMAYCTWFVVRFEPGGIEGDSRGWESLLSQKAKPRYTVEWSPDGSQIVFTGFPSAVGHPASIYVARADGSSLQRIAEGVEREVYISPDISPDGTRLVYATTRHGNFEIETSALDGSNRRRLTDTGRADHDVAPAWSPSGDRIAFARVAYGDQVEKGIYVMDADGANPRRIVAFREWDPEAGQFEGAYSHRAGPAWSPDGAMLAYVADGITQAPGEEVKHEDGLVTGLLRGNLLYTVRADGSELTLVATTGGRSAYRMSAPGWSPDGQRLAFSIDEEVDVSHYTGRPDGTDLQQQRVAAGFGGTMASWSPDGSEILFGAYVVRPDGSGLRRLGVGASSRQSQSSQSWSPDGSRIAVFDPARGIFIIARDGTDPRLVVKREPNTSAPDSAVYVSASER